MSARTIQAVPVGALPGRASETPYWDAARERLVWAEIATGGVHSWEPRTGRTTSIHFDGTLGCVVPRASGGFAVALDERVLLVPESGEPRVLVELGDGLIPRRLNDGVCDVEGALWTGSMTLDLRPGLGSLYRVEPSGAAREVLTGIGLSNGLAWSPAGDRLYFIDSFAGGVDALEIDRELADVRRTRLVDVPNDVAAPFGLTVADGLTVDAEGHLWVAIFGAGEVHRYSPRGILDIVVSTPHLAPTSCAFGGPELTDLYITSGAENTEHVFHCRPGVRGLPVASFAG